MVLFRYIILNLGRKKKQTFFSLLCISVSSLVILADYALLNGMEAGLKEAINGVMSGQLTVYSSENEQINILEAQLTDQRPFQWSDEERHRLQDEFPAISLDLRIRIGSLISYGEETSYVNLHALEKQHLAKVNSMLVFLKGRMAEKAGEVVISETIAEDLHCMVGDTVLLVATNIYDYMSDAIGVVSGIFEERGLAIFLSYNGFMPYESGQLLAGVGEEEALELVINPMGEKDISPAETEALRLWLSGNVRQPLQLAAWDQTVPLLYTIVKVWRGGGVITQVLFVLFSLIILITLISLIVYSRRKELGTLLAIGFSWNKIRMLLCAEYILLCVFSVGIAFGGLAFLLVACDGGVISIASKDMQSALMTDRLYPFLRMTDLVSVFFLFALTVILSVLISVRRLQKGTVRELIYN